jgi:PAS domain S-box-containing protein
MDKPRWFEFWSRWGLVARLMLGVGLAVAAGGTMQSLMLAMEGAEATTARLNRELRENLANLAPLVADQALTGDYASIEQILRQQVTKAEVEHLRWTDRDGRVISVRDQPVFLTAPFWFNILIDIEIHEDIVEVTAGGVSYGKLAGQMTPVRAENRLWEQFVRQLQIVAATLFLMLQLIWLIFRGNLGTMRSLAEGANRFSRGDHSVRIEPQGAPEVRQAAEAFNNMATSTESVLNSLRASEAKNRLLAAIVEQSSEAIWTRDLEGRVISWNAGATAMLGYSPAEAMGRTLEVGVGSEAEEQARRERLAAGERFSYHAKASTKRGEQIDLQIALAPLTNEANEMIGTIAVARDVTQSMRAEEALRQAREAAESANHAKSSFLARMSHEIRTPMNGVLGMTELLLESGLTSIQRKYAETVQRSGTNLLGIINDVLDFSKIEAGKLELESVEMDLRRVLEDTVDLLAERAHAKGLELACSIPAGFSAGVRGDPLRLGQVLTNLAGNAIKFTETGSVLLSVAALDQDETHVRVRFEVRDTGAGISEEAQARIFDEFSQADGSTTRKHGGSGLGLAISKQLVEMMGGGLHVESRLGSGSNFWFTCRFEKVASAEDAAGAPVGALNGVRTLIVEASAVSRGILRSQVANWGMAQRVAESPEHAIEQLVQATARGAPFELAVLDLGLPGSAMLELAREIRRHPGIAKLHLVMLAPVGNHALVREAREAGLDACLVKPVRQSALYECLVGTVTGHGGINEAAATVGSHQHETGGQHRGNILLVEDNLINQAVALGMLKKIEGYNVAVAGNGVEALRAHTDHPFDLILMDCHMPEMDGYEATRQIRAREAAAGSVRVPIVALTANAMAQDREECLAAGMDDHLSKPFTRNMLADVLERWMPDRTAPVPTASAEAPADPERAAGPALLDSQVLDQLSELQDADDPDLLSRVLGLYVTESPRLIDKLRQASSAGNALEMARAAHALKSSSANIGAILLADLAGQLQQAGESGSLEQARVLLARIEAEHPRVQDALRLELQS